MEDDVLSQIEARGSKAKNGQARLILGVALVGFLLGAGAVGYFAWDGGLDVFGTDETIAAGGNDQRQTFAEPEPSPSVSAAAAQAAQAVEKVAEQQGGLDARLVAMEQRLSALDLQAQAAVGNTARAEGLLIAFATRRAIERGAPLGYLGDQLKLRFGDARPKAVQVVIEAAEAPITLDQLLARLEGLAPELANPADDQVSWGWFTREMADLFVIRRESSPSPAPEKRLDRARLFLETSRIEAAVSEVRNLPGADAARDWIEDAERYAAAQRALDLLETTAVLEPRELRDGGGNRVEQLSPAGKQGRD